MLTMSRMLLLALVLLPASSVSAQQVSDGDRFNLYASCAQMHPSLGRRASAWWDEVGLTENAVLRAVNSRLRAARLYNERSPLSPMLGVNVFVIPDHRFRVTVSLPTFRLRSCSMRTRAFACRGRLGSGGAKAK